jgi:predicted nucleic acid-binding protein
MARFVNPLFVNNFIDANIMDDIADSEDDAVNRIVGMTRNDAVQILLSYSVQDELNHPNTPAHVRRAASEFDYSKAVQLTPMELANIEKLVEHAKGNADLKNIRRDLFHVSEAGKYGGYFITRDKRLLARADKIANFLGVEVVTPSTFLQRVEHARKL